MVGLATCYGILKGNQGSIHVSSKGLDQGTAFFFTMRMLLPEEAKSNDAINEIPHEENSMVRLLSDDLRLPRIMFTSNPK